MGAMNHTEGSWLGLGITATLWIFSSLTLNDAATICTILAGASTIIYNLYRYKKDKK